VWHVKIEEWILDQAKIKFVSGQASIRVVV